MMSVWTKFRSALRAFRVARAGNVAITFAFATFPIIGVVGYAVDYSRANSVKVSMQAALDSTALMISKEAATDTPDTLQTNAKNYFLALFNNTDVKNITVTANYSNTAGTQVAISASVDVPTTFLAAVGWDTMTVGNTSTVKWGSSRLRVALVLDNTGSMSQGGTTPQTSKLAALKTATANLLTQLKNAATVNGDVYVSIVPFVKDVNLDPSNWSSDYIYWGTPAQDTTLSDDTSWDANNGTCNIAGNSPRKNCLQQSSCSMSGYNDQTSCTAAAVCSISTKTTQTSCTSTVGCTNPGETNQNNCTSNNACSNPNYTSRTTCKNNGGTWTKGTWGHGVWTTGVWTQAVWTPYAHNDSVHGWNGCVMDRGYPASPSYLTVSGTKMSGPDTTNNYDTNVEQPDITKNPSLYAAEQYSTCSPVGNSTLQPVMGLSYDWTTMNSLVTNMQAAGNTNQAIGLQLGWMSLVGGGPFTAPAMDSNYTYNQVIILLTDGLNTQNRWTSTQSLIDQRQQTTCDNINKAGITLYTIQVNTDQEATSTLLQNCAGTPATATQAAVYPDPTKFFLLTSPDQIVTTFNQIGTKLSNLYVAK